MLSWLSRAEPPLFFACYSPLHQVCPSLYPADCRLSCLTPPLHSFGPEAMHTLCSVATCSGQVIQRGISKPLRAPVPGLARRGASIATILPSSFTTTLVSHPQLQKTYRLPSPALPPPRVHLHQHGTCLAQLSQTASLLVIAIAPKVHL